MARKSTEVVITEPGRDAGKIFQIFEMSASHAEKWAARALLVAAQSGSDIGNVRAGMAGVAVMGIGTILGAKFQDVEPLLDEMFECVAICPDPRNHSIIRGGKYCSIHGGPNVVGRLVEDDIEEVSTRVRLRSEVLNLHVGFTWADALSKWMPGMSAPTDTPNASTSQPQSTP